LGIYIFGHKLLKWATLKEYELNHKYSSMKSLIQTHQELKDSLDVTVKIDWRQVLKIVVEDLIKKRRAASNKNKDAFDKVLT